jgi:hypothetical protein
MSNLPPSGPGKRVSHWARRKKFQLRHLPQYVIGFILHVISRWLNLHPKTVIFMRRALELGNPTNTIWPSETIPMNSRLFAGGFWNYGFFQFHRQFYFPLWAHLQYNPSNKSFIPRSHNILSMNQTQRNWVAVSFPGKTNEVSIDLAGGVMPEHDSYTIEFAALEKGEIIRPHDDLSGVSMKSLSPDTLQISWLGRKLEVSAEQTGARIRAYGQKNLIISIRPFNMEGPSFIDRLAYSNSSGRISGDVNGVTSKVADLVHISNLERGDSLRTLKDLIKKSESGAASFKTKKKKRKKISHESRCHAGLTNAVFLYSKASDVDFTFYDRNKWKAPPALFKKTGLNRETAPAKEIWQAWFPALPVADLPAPFGSWFQDASVNLLTLWDFDAITPGSFTYHHFWIRDAVIMMNSLMHLGGFDATAEIIKKFPGYVRRNGLFASQAGEWDANGQALWILGKYASMTGDVSLLKKNIKGIHKMIRWIEKATLKNGGVIPPGFSAEHLGVADWYLWDNFWSIGGLNALENFSDIIGRDLTALQTSLSSSLESYLSGYKYYPAALGRKKDAGMIGSIAAIYPMALNSFFNERMKNTLDIIYEDYFFKGGFFQENIHSGINPYLTLQLAQAYLFMGEIDRAYAIADKLSGWAKALHSFPEAVHPKTRGGCMGDGFHGWAFAELISYVKNMFVLELQNKIILCAGIPRSWYKNDFSLKNLHTSAGCLTFQYRSGTLQITGLSSEIKNEVMLSVPKDCKISGEKVKAVNNRNKPHLHYATDRDFYAVSQVGLELRFELKG